MILGCIQNLRLLACCLAALSGNDFAGRLYTKAPHKTDFGQASEQFNDLQQNRASVGEKSEYLIIIILISC